jgi:tryptophan-rich sensory protein
LDLQSEASARTNHTEREKKMSALLVVIAILAVGYGLISLSQATLGVGMIAIGCFVAILARLVQAAEHHRALSRPKA